MRRSAAGRRFYRLVRSSPPTTEDFVPQGRVPGYRTRPGMAGSLLDSVMNGISVYDEVEAARDQHEMFRRRPKGSPLTHISTLDVPASSPISCDDEFGNDHHWDLFGSRSDLLACVTPPDLPL